MIEFTLKLDPVTRDLMFDGNGIMLTVEGDEATAQNITNTLNTWLGEFMLDETHGTDYELILGDNYFDATDDEVKEIIRDAILQEPQVTLIKSINVERGESRTLTFGFDGELASGSSISLEELKQSG